MRSKSGPPFILFSFAVQHTSELQFAYEYISSVYYTPRFNRVERGGGGGILVSPCPSVCLSVCPSVDRIVSALYLQQYSLDPYHICTSYQATSEGVSGVMSVTKFKNLKFWRILKICNLDFVFFWLGIQYDSIEWVIMRRRGVSSERRHSSCSSSNYQGPDSIKRCRLTSLGNPIVEIRP